MFEAVSQIAAPYGDLVEATGDVAGGDGKAGDVVVTLNPADARNARYVVEAKDRKLGPTPARDELERSMKNRQAQAGVLVFSSQENAPTAVAFSHFENRAIVVLDKDEGDLGALRLGCMWARWIVQRQAGPAADGIDARRIEALIDDAARSLKRVTTIRRAHTAAKNQIDAAGSELGTLEQELKSVLDELAAQLEAAAD